MPEIRPTILVSVPRVFNKVYDGLQKMIAVRKTIPAFADYNNRWLIETGNPHLFVFMRNNPFELDDKVVVVDNWGFEKPSTKQAKAVLEALGVHVHPGLVDPPLDQLDIDETAEMEIESGTIGSKRLG